jgi:pimeloyl-ACP methyl ester carboxylesterase
VDYASKQGYPVLAYDRICNGESERLHGVLDCQVPLNADILHQLILMAKSGAFGGRTFSSIIPVGHSLGSLTQQYLAQTVPDAAGIFIQTGFSAFFARALPTALITVGFLPASVADPSLDEIDPTYLVLSSEQGATNFFYGGDYLEAVAHYDFVHRGSVPLGEVATALLGQIPAPSYTKAVFVLDGQEDAAFCGQNVLAPVLGSVKGNCGIGSGSLTAQSAGLFPHAQSYGWNLVPETGHCINLHEHAQQAYTLAHQYLEAQGY